MGILAEFEYLLNQWQISNGYTSLNTKLQFNRASESNNLKSPKHKPQAQSNIIIAKEKSRTLSNNQPAMVAHEVDKLLTVLDSDDNSNTSNAKRMKFDEDDEEKFVSK